MAFNLRISGGRKLLSPSGIGTRPTTSLVREAVMNLLGTLLQECLWLDLFSGSGAIGCEALQRGARKVIAVEKDFKVARTCKANLIATASGLSKKKEIEVIRRDVIDWLKEGFKSKYLKGTEPPKANTPYGFDVVYLDPPYESKIYLQVLQALLDGNWIKKSSIVICEYSAHMKLQAPDGWIENDNRKYGNTSLLLVTPQESCYVGTDSKHLQTNQAM